MIKLVVMLFYSVFALSGVASFFYGLWIEDAWLFAVGASFLVVFLLLGILATLTKLYELILAALEALATEHTNGQEKAASNGHQR